jgi:G:T-mismatch repair DNA endonuclease (very short patch repair protein)
MSRKRKLNRKCEICESPISDYNKSGYCNKHINRNGVNNPFYGKKHSKETIEKIIKVTSINSKKLWQNKEYRDKVIKGVSKPRKESFKKEQRERIKQWYIDNPIQKEIRSNKMKNSWKKGAIVKNNNFHSSKSKMQHALYKNLKEVIDWIEENACIKIKTKWVFPDILIEKDGIIIEFYGNYWHANPKIYKENDIVHHNIKAKEIWESDKARIKMLENQGYSVIIIWQDEYKNNKTKIIQSINNLINWEGCSL